MEDVLYTFMRKRLWFDPYAAAAANRHILHDARHNNISFWQAGDDWLSLGFGKWDPHLRVFVRRVESDQQEYGGDWWFVGTRFE